MSAPSNSNTLRKHQDAIDTYNKLSNEMEQIGDHKYKKYRDSYCLAKAAFQHYISPRTLERTLYGTNF